jgi:succinate dehydrogenase hydrophobic anchor subunit
MKNRWTWLVQYATAAILALLLASILGSSQLFQTTRFGENGLAASNVVWFIGYGVVLFLIWFGAGRAAATLPEDGNWKSFLRRTITPLATLVVLALGYQVPLFLLRPFMSDVAMTTYGWLFVAAITAAAIWFAYESYVNSELLLPTVYRFAHSVRDAAAETKTGPSVGVRCRQCGMKLEPGVTKCPSCGHALSAA